MGDVGVLLDEREAERDPYLYLGERGDAVVIDRPCDEVNVLGTLLLQSFLADIGKGVSELLAGVGDAVLVELEVHDIADLRCL